MQRIAPSRDIFTSVSKKLTLAELTKLAPLNKAHKAMVSTYLYTVVFRNPDILLRELSSLTVPQLSRFLVKYTDKLNALCNVILAQPGHAHTIEALAIKSLVMNVAEYKQAGMTAQKLAEVVDFVEAHGFPEHFIETMKFQQLLIQDLEDPVVIDGGDIRRFKDSANVIRLWKLTDLPNIECYKNLRGVGFGRQSPQNLPRKFWWHANLLGVNLGALDCGGKRLDGAHIDFNNAFIFMLHNFYVYKFVPEVNYFPEEMSAEYITKTLTRYSDIFSGKNEGAMSGSDVAVRALLYSTHQHLYDGYQTKNVVVSMFRLVQMQILKQLLGKIAGIDAAQGYHERLELLNIAMRHPLFAPTAAGNFFSGGLKSFFKGKGNMDCRKIIRAEIAKYEVAGVEQRERDRLSQRGV